MRSLDSSNDASVASPNASRLDAAQPAVGLFVPGFVRAMADGYGNTERRLDPASVIACALRWTARRGRSLSALPTLVRTQLDMVCEAGDPAALLVRDWIDGRGPLDIHLALENHAGVASADANPVHDGRV